MVRSDLIGRAVFRGTELYPRVFGADIKMFTNCRFGMMYWAVGAVIYAYAQQTMYGSVSSSMAVSQRGWLGGGGGGGRGRCPLLLIGYVFYVEIV